MKSYSTYLFLLAASVAVSGCSEDSSTTPEPPAPPVVTVTVVTQPTTQITQTAATFNGSLSTTGNPVIIERGFCYGTSVNPTTANAKVFNGNTIGTYFNNVIDLVANTLYHVRAYAKTATFTYYGNDSTFTTLPSVVVVVTKPSVTTNVATNVTTTTAKCSGTLVSTGGESLTEWGIYFGTTPNVQTTGTKLVINSGDFSVNLTNLTPNTTYYVRAYATNSKGIAFGEEKTFKTSVALAIGVEYQGGIIFYILKSGDYGYKAGEIHGLIAAKNDIGSDISSNNGYEALTYGIIKSYIGYGLSNTEKLVSVFGVNKEYAARKCYEYSDGVYSDWYLPSLNELVELYKNRKIVGESTFTTNKYCSSTVFSYDTYYVNFSDGSTGNTQSMTYAVRPIRSF